MHYEFPHINHIDEVLAAIAGREEFVVRECPIANTKTINYLVNFEDTFPPVTDRRTALLRECRGIMFCADTGRVVARKFHKFFNLGERAETLPENVDFTQPHYHVEKLDGSMMTPLLVNGEVRWCSKMGLTPVAEPVDAFTADKPHYHEFAKHWFAKNHTPMFEWCSRKQRIVIDYPVDRLVLTAIRDNVTGKYVGRDELVATAAEFGIEVAKASEVLTAFDHNALDSIRNVEGEEGQVFTFAEGPLAGHKVKVKGAWYSNLHKTLDHLRFEKDVIRLILDEKLDDAKPFLPEDLMKSADDFAREIYTGLRKLASDIFWEAQADFDNFNGSKKKFADRVIRERKDMSKFLFYAWDHLEAGEEGLYQWLLKFVYERLSTQGRVDEMRHLWGGKCWYSYRDAPVEGED